MATESWRTVAEALANRLFCQANICPVGRPVPGVSPGDPALVHRVPEEHADDCPFCADTAAYNRYLRKVRCSS